MTLETEYKQMKLNTQSFMGYLKKSKIYGLYIAAAAQLTIHTKNSSCMNRFIQHV